LNENFGKERITFSSEQYINLSFPVHVCVSLVQSEKEIEEERRERE